jgi:hypothetical protein
MRKSRWRLIDGLFLIIGVDLDVQGVGYIGRRLEYPISVWEKQLFWIQ